MLINNIQPLSLPYKITRRTIISTPISIISTIPFITVADEPPLPCTSPPKDVLSLYNRALSYQTTPGQLPASLPLLRRVVNLSPCFPYGHSSLADTLSATSMVKEAAKEYTTAIELLTPRTGDNRENVDIQAALTGRDGKLSDLHLNRGACYMNLLPNPDYQAALVDFSTAGELRGKPDVNILINRGICNDYLGRYYSAVSDFQVVERIGGKIEPWRLRYVHCLWEVGDEKNARRVWGGLREKFPEVEEVLVFGVVLGLF